jgi:Uma2 family endonuclease
MSTSANELWLKELRPQPEPMTAAEYEALDEDSSRRIEVIDGYVVFCESPSRPHQRAGRRLANLIEKCARRQTAQGGGCMTVDTDIDMRIHDVPLTNRRPDIVLYRCLPDDQRLRAEHAILVVEVVSPGSETADAVDKFAEYAKTGIPHYWIVRLAAGEISTIERYQLDPASGIYWVLGTLFREDRHSTPTIEQPIPMEIDWSDLDL